MSAYKKICKTIMKNYKVVMKEEEEEGKKRKVVLFREKKISGKRTRRTRTRG